MRDELLITRTKLLEAYNTATSDSERKTIRRRLDQNQDNLNSANIRGAENKKIGDKYRIDYSNGKATIIDISKADEESKVQQRKEINKDQKIGESAYPSLDRQTTEEVNKADQAKKIIEELNENFDNLTDEEKEKYNNAVKQFNAAKEKLEKLYPCSSANETGAKGTALPGVHCGELFIKTEHYNAVMSVIDTERDTADPCGSSQMSKIHTALSKFFIALKGLKKYGEFYLNGAINKIGRIRNLIKKTAKIIASALKSLIQRARDFLLSKIREAINNLIDVLFPTVAKQWKSTIVGQIVNTILCAFKDIIAGLVATVQDFLFELVGKVVNIPFCAAEQFANSLLNNIAATIDNALGPVLDQINNLLGGIGKIAGSIFEAIDMILGFQAFLCAEPNCPEINTFRASPWGGPTQSMKDDFNNFLPIPDAENVSNDITGYIDNLSIFGTELGETSGTIDQNITQCNTAAFECGPPTVEIFGGGGLGAFGRAVIDRAGRIAGVDLLSGGSGYSSPPFVTFIDTCNRGQNASAYTEINDDGEVIRVVMVDSGNGYLNAPDGTNEFNDENDYVTSLIGTLPVLNLNTTIPVASEQVNDYIMCLDEFKVMSTGIGYTVDDEISIVPDVPGLEVSVQMTQEGQILSLQVLNAPCGLTDVPTITINSETGAGAKIKPILSFNRLEDGSGQKIPDEIVSMDVNSITLDQTKVIRVIDCPTDTCIGCK